MVGSAGSLPKAVSNVTAAESRSGYAGRPAMSPRTNKPSIEAHGGRFWAENNSSGGATFRFTLPITGKAAVK